MANRRGNQGSQGNQNQNDAEVKAEKQRWADSDAQRAEDNGPGFVGEELAGGNVKGPEYQGVQPLHEAAALMKVAQGDNNTVLTGSQTEHGPADGLKASSRLVGPPLRPPAAFVHATASNHVRMLNAGLDPHHRPEMDAPTTTHPIAGGSGGEDGLRVVGRRIQDAGKDYNPYDPNAGKPTQGATHDYVPAHAPMMGSEQQRIQAAQQGGGQLNAQGQPVSDEEAQKALREQEEAERLERERRNS